MTEASDRQELRAQVRDEQPPDDSVVVVRGRPASLVGLRKHATRTHDAYVLDGRPLWGVSVFCALDDIGPASLDALLRRFASFRVLHLPKVGDLRAAGFAMLPTFRRPHFTIALGTDSDDALTQLLTVLGTAERNPYHGARRR
jgi:hypothetical protein